MNCQLYAFVFTLFWRKFVIISSYFRFLFIFLLFLQEHNSTNANFYYKKRQLLKAYILFPTLNNHLFNLLFFSFRIPLIFLLYPQFFHQLFPILFILCGTYAIFHTVG